MSGDFHIDPTLDVTLKGSPKRGEPNFGLMMLTFGYHMGYADPGNQGVSDGNDTRPRFQRLSKGDIRAYEHWFVGGTHMLGQVAVVHNDGYYVGGAYAVNDRLSNKKE